MNGRVGEWENGSWDVSGSGSWDVSGRMGVRM